MKKGEEEAPAEVDALGKVLAALQELDDRQRGWVINSAVSNLSITSAAAPAGAASGSGGLPSTSNTPAGGAGLPGTPGNREHARAFMRQKAPESDVLRIACRAFCLYRFKSTPTFKGKELKQVNLDAAGPKINFARAIDNATRRSGYLAGAPGGKKQITGLGEDVVEALPNQERVGEVEATATRRGGKTKKKKKKLI